jgi:ribosome biogenesis protein MAK21
VQSHSSDGSELDFMEDEDDLVSDLDGEGDDPIGLIEYAYDASGSEKEQEGESDGEWQGFDSEPKPKKRGRETDADEGKKKRRKLKALPTFASYEDYAAMIENSKDEDV